MDRNKLKEQLDIIGGQIKALQDSFANAKRKDAADLPGQLDILEKLADGIRIRMNDLNKALSGSAGGSAVPSKPSVAQPKTDRHEKDTETDSFSNFFTLLGRGMIETQRQLDQQTKDYLRGIRDQPYILPSVFRVPKLSGELKVAMSMEKDEKVNLIIASRKEATKELQEQTINFEITAAPPPPDTLARIQSLAPSMGLVLAPEDRHAILQTVRDALSGVKGKFAGNAPTIPKAKAHAETALKIGTAPSATERSQARHILIVHDEDRGTYLLLALYRFPDTGDDLIGLWELRPAGSAGDPPETVLTQIWKLGKAAKPNEYQRLSSILEPMINRQIRFLDNLSAGGA